MQRRYAVDLALDKALRGADEGFNVAVLKPGRREWREMLDGVPERVRVVMTSAMDHAIGRALPRMRLPGVAGDRWAHGSVWPGHGSSLCQGFFF